MRRILICATVMMLLACCALAQEAPLCPELTDPVDKMVQRLCVMSQRDEAFEGIKYNNGHLTARGCQPVSIANAVIAAFGVEDRQAAVDVVKETARLLVSPRHPGKGKVELSNISLLLDIQQRAAQAAEYPMMAETIGAYDGKTAVYGGQLDAQILEQLIAETDEPFVIAGRMTVHPDWTALIELVCLLHEKGMDDALLCLANVGAGKETSGTPLGLGKSGHYLTMLIHVGTFMEQGRMYVLDSLPRAIEGEESGYTYVLRAPYPFAQGETAFGNAFEAARIRETVIRLTHRDEAAWSAADVTQKAEQLAPLILYGPGVLMIAAP